MKTDPDVLTPQLLEAVLAKLGFSDRPPPTLEGLRQVYAAWCRRVPFDNVRKLIHIVRATRRRLDEKKSGQNK